jgi:hypothetical protein
MPRAAGGQQVKDDTRTVNSPARQSYYRLVRRKTAGTEGSNDSRSRTYAGTASGFHGTSKRDRPDLALVRTAQRRRNTLKGAKPQERRLVWPVRRHIQPPGEFKPADDPG